MAIAFPLTYFDSLKNIEVGLDDEYSSLLDDGEKIWLLHRVTSAKQYSAAIAVNGCSADVQYRNFLMDIGRFEGLKLHHSPPWPM